mmetsp:Transcript_98882/g.276912  ORF Transcript_98882/g.276912 Transcript_98882/m.276912 type:complete len:96 (-) Transcript_98882:152-439(-)
MLTLLSNLVQYFAYHSSQYRGGCLAAPTVYAGLAFVLMMVHPTIFLLKDLNLTMPTCRNKWGMRLVYACTYLGFVNLIYATVLAARTGSRSCLRN